MASLAVLVSLIVLSILLIGPVGYLLCSFKWMPNWLVWIISALSISLGIWFFLLPIPAIRYIGLIPVLCGVLSIRNKSFKTTEFEKQMEIAKRVMIEDHDSLSRLQKNNREPQEKST